MKKSTAAISLVLMGGALALPFVYVASKTSETSGEPAPSSSLERERARSAREIPEPSHPPTSQDSLGSGTAPQDAAAASPSHSSGSNAFLWYMIGRDIGRATAPTYEPPPVQTREFARSAPMYVPPTRTAPSPSTAPTVPPGSTTQPGTVARPSPAPSPSPSSTTTSSRGGFGASSGGSSSSS